MGNKRGFKSGDFSYILSRYGVDYLLLHQTDQAAGAYLQTLDGAEGFELIDCFSPSAGALLWAEPICLVRVGRPAPLGSGQKIEGRLRDGWSGVEPWGIWAEEVTAELQFVALEKQEQLLHLSLFPHCAVEQQTVTIAVNGRPLETYAWPGCDPVDLAVPIPAELIRVDWNTVTLTFGFSRSPAEVTGGANPDTRPLAAGLTAFSVDTGR